MLLYKKSVGVLDILVSLIPAFSCTMFYVLLGKPAAMLVLVVILALIGLIIVLLGRMLFDPKKKGIVFLFYAFDNLYKVLPSNGSSFKSRKVIGSNTQSIGATNVIKKREVYWEIYLASKNKKYRVDLLSDKKKALDKISLLNSKISK